MSKFPASYADLSPSEINIGLEVAKVGLGKVDYVNDTVILDQIAAEFFDLPSNLAISRKELHDRIHPKDWPTVEREVDILLAPEQPDVIDVTHRIVADDGNIRWVNARKRVFFAEGERDSAPLTGVFAVVDISSRKSAEIRAEYLIGELNHRTKNLLAVASSIVRHLDKYSSSDELGQKIIDRLQALARNQDAMLAASSESVELKSVVQKEVWSFASSDTNRIEMFGPKIKISSDAAQVIAMITHELATNAAKYGALSNSTGIIKIVWSVDEDENFSFNWSEHGGPLVVKPSRSGFGTQMLTSYAKAAVGGEPEIAYEPSGLEFSLTASLKRISS